MTYSCFLVGEQYDVYRKPQKEADFGHLVQSHGCQAFKSSLALRQFRITLVSGLWKIT